MKQKDLKFEKGCLVVKKDELEEVKRKNTLVVNIHFEVDDEGIVVAKVYISKTYYVIDDEGKKIAEEFGSITNYLLEEDGTKVCKLTSPEYYLVENCERWVKTTIDEIEKRRTEIARRIKEMKRNLKDFSIVLQDEEEA